MHSDRVVSDVAVGLMTPERFAVYWPHIEKELDRVPQLWDRWWTKEAIYEATMRGILNAWELGTEKEVKAVLFTQITYYPANKILNLIMLFGNSIEEWLPMTVAVLEDWARQQGCSYVELPQGRPGWEKLLAPFGMKRQGVVLGTRISETRRH